MQQPRGGRLAAARLAHEPERLAPQTSKETPSTALHGADLLLEDDPLAQREVLDEVADLDQRARRHARPRRSAAPASARRAAAARRRPSCAASSARRRRCARLVGRRARRAARATAARRVCGRQQARDLVRRRRPSTRLELSGRSRLCASRTYGQRGWNEQPAGQVDQRRRAARDRHELLVARRVQARDRARAGPRCRGARAPRRSCPCRPCSTIRPAYITRDLVGHLGDHAEVVGDHHDRRVELALQALDQLEDLRLDGHVERRRRLVGDQQLRVVDERHRDHRALAHAAGELVRVGVDAPARLGDADQPEHLDGAVAAPAPWRRRGARGPPPRAGRRSCRRDAARTAGPGRSSRCRRRGSRAARRRSAVSRSLPSKRDRAGDARVARARQAHHRQRGDALARARTRPRCRAPGRGRRV